MRLAVQKYFIYIKTAVLGIFLSFFLGHTQAQPLQKAAKANELKAFSAALGLESLTEYSSILNSLGFKLYRNLGFIGSYQELEFSKYLGGRVAEEAATRVNTRLALDVFSSLKQGKRVYGRFGVYLWDVNMSFNYSTAEMKFSHGGLSQLIGVGGAFQWKSFFTNVDLEYFSSSQFMDESEVRLMINFSSKFN